MKFRHHRLTPKPLICAATYGARRGWTAEQLAKLLPPLKMYASRSSGQIFPEDTSKYKLEQQSEDRANQTDYGLNSYGFGARPNHDIALIRNCQSSPDSKSHNGLIPTFANRWIMTAYSEAHHLRCQHQDAQPHCECLKK